MKNGKRDLIYFFLLPLYFLLHSYNRVFPFIDKIEILYPYFVIVAAGMLLLVFFNRFFQSRLKAGFTVFLIMASVFYYGLWHSVVVVVFRKGWVTNYLVALFFYVLFVTLGWVYITRTEKRLKSLISYLNLLLILFVVFELGILIQRILGFQKDRNLIYSDWKLYDNYSASGLKDSLKPDIYFFVFDEYTSTVSLKEKWQFDNSYIDNWLEKENFYIVSNGLANYNQTPYSVSSELNMDYLPENKCPQTINHRLLLQSIKSMSENQVCGILLKEGYQLFFKAPFENSLEKSEGIHFFEQLPYASTYSTCLFYGKQGLSNSKWGINYLFPKKIQALSFCYTDTLKKEYFKMCAEDIETQLQEIKSTVDKNENRPPKFVYGHLMITHTPHQFDSTGTIKPFEKLKDQHFIQQRYKETYIDQVKFANKKIQELVTYIKSNSKKNTVIIIQGDHGFRHFADKKYDFPNFNGIYFPNGNYDSLYQTMSPVNTFRVMFNNFFKKKYPLLKDSTIYLNY